MYDGDTPTWQELYADDYRAAHEDRMYAEYGACECGGIAFHNGLCQACSDDVEADYRDHQRDLSDLF